MKRDLERWKEKMTPQEERRIWSKIQGSIRKGKTRRTLWLPRPWLSRAVAAAAAVAVAVAIWQADLLEPEKTLKRLGRAERQTAEEQA